MITYDNKEYDNRAYGPFDRGMADSYYWRERDPHFFARETTHSRRFEADEMTESEIEAYNAGYDFNCDLGDFKDWGRDE